MKKIYNRFLVLILLAFSYSATFATSFLSLSSKSFGDPGFHLHLKNTDTLRLRANNLKDNRLTRPYLIFTAPRINITKHLFIGSSSPSLEYSAMEAQYQNIFGNFSVSTPIHDQMTLSYSLVRDNMVTAKIYNILGSEVTTLFSEYQFAGQQKKIFNIADRIGSGIYILRLTAGNEAKAARIQVL